MYFDVLIMRAFGLCWNLALYAYYPRALWDFVYELGYFPNIVFPRTYNEKMFWRRVFDTDPKHISYCDKLAVKKVFSDASHDVELAKVVWQGSQAIDIPEALMSSDVVLKTNNASSRNISLPDVGKSDAEIIAQFQSWLTSPYKPWNREWGYCKVEPLVFAEEKIATSGGSLEDLKVHVFGGKVYYTLIYQHEGTPHSKSAIFDKHGKRLSVTNTVVKKHPHRALGENYVVPKSYHRAMAVAEKISTGTDYLRVDFMWDGHDLYGGEVTLYPTGGRMTNSDSAVLADMSSRWNLNLTWFMRTNHSGWRAWYQKRLRYFIYNQKFLGKSSRLKVDMFG